MTEQRDPHAGYGRMGRLGRPQEWGMVPILLAVVALLFAGYLIFGASPEAPNTTRSSEYQRPVAPGPATQPGTSTPN